MGLRAKMFCGGFATASPRRARPKSRVGFLGVDGTRTELEFLKTVYLSALEAGAKEIVVVDTIGACGPEAAEYLVRQGWQGGGKEVPVPFYGHNDFWKGNG